MEGSDGSGIREGARTWASEDAPRLCPELGPRELVALRAASSRCARIHADTCSRVRGRCSLGTLVEAGVLDDLLGRGVGERLRREADDKFGACQ